jgi:glycosyltransferase involved in cell wall biosynthesis
MLYIRKIMGRELEYINGYYRVQVEMDKILYDYDDIVMLYHYYQQPKNIIDHFIKRLVKYPRFLRKSESKDIVNHIIVQHLSDLARKLNPDMTLKGLKKCKHIIAISEFTKQEAIEKLGIDEKKITVIKCGVNRDIFHPIESSITTKKLKILHVGTEGGRKDFLTLLYAFQEVKKYDKDAVLIRVGKPEYINKIKELGLENDIKYISNISDNDLNLLYNFVDLFVFPSIYEGYGLSIMESLSCGTPVICSDIPVFREIYGDSVTYFPVKDHLSLAVKILASGLNKKSKDIIIEKGLKLAEENKWKGCANQYLNYIKQRFS